MPAKPNNLVVVISGHGYGHAAMTAPLLQALHVCSSGLNIIVRSNLPEAHLRTLMPFGFEYHREATDFGMTMFDAFKVDTDKSLAKYQYLHQHWHERVNEEAERLTQLKTDYLISNIAYLPLAAASQLAIPAIAYGCLNWAEIFQYYFSQQQQIYRQIFAAYASATCIIRTQPTMPMAGLSSETVGPIATMATDRRSFLLDKLGLAENTRLVLTSMGGIKTDLNIKHWPIIENIHYLLDDQAPDDRPDISSLIGLDISFIDTLGSVDLFLTKPGYGSFSQAACNRIPVLYVERPDWPEHPYLCDWLKKHIPCISISQQKFCHGQFANELISLLEQDISPVRPDSGLCSAIDIVLNRFNIHSNQ